jgi:hypothetical protein
MSKYFDLKLQEFEQRAEWHWLEMILLLKLELLMQLELLLH